MAATPVNPHIKLEGQPVTKPEIKYAIYDSFATRLSDDGEIWVCSDDGRWHVPSRPMQVFCFEAKVLSEAEYRRVFDKYDLPPLPMHAFCRDGWRSPLV
jgi:hypothetical protein